jgi:Integrase zinc binding domain
LLRRPFRRRRIVLKEGGEWDIFRGGSLQPHLRGQGLQVLATGTRQEQSKLLPIGIEEMVREQASYELCMRLHESTSERCLFDIDNRGLHVRKAPLDGAHQVVVPQALVPMLLHMKHYPKTSVHPGTSQMRRTLRRTYFWPTIALDVVYTVKQCEDCTRNSINLAKRTNLFKLFPANCPFGVSCNGHPRSIDQDPTW